MKKVLFFCMLSALAWGCSSNSENSDAESTSPQEKLLGAKEENDGKGIGEIKHVDLNSPLNMEMVKTGEGIYDMKCSACHKLTAQRVVGPGWKGITTKRKPEWIMNMTLNVEVMLEKDPAAYELLKECLIRMPNQNLTKEDARNVLEFMYANDNGSVTE